MQNGTTAWSMKESGLAARPEIDISQRLVPREVMKRSPSSPRKLAKTPFSDLAYVHGTESGNVGKLQPESVQTMVLSAWS